MCRAARALLCARVCVQVRVCARHRLIHRRCADVLASWLAPPSGGDAAAAAALMVANSAGATPLHSAAAAGAAGATALLCERLLGAPGATPPAAAQCLQWLHQPGPAGQSALHLAAQSSAGAGAADCLRTLLLGAAAAA
eukprot:COSAG01_NODE_1440_length_10297_cov_8.117572_1_plen_138_part_10